MPEASVYNQFDFTHRIVLVGAGQRQVLPGICSGSSA
jgi:hypothetical protein